MDVQLTASPSVTAVATAAAPATEGGISFHQILSALNPLQYLPVVGTIYRAVTGDTIPESWRVVGSFAVSALTGGPVGMLVNAATTLVEKATGIDPEKITANLFDSIGLGSTRAATSVADKPSPIQEAAAPALPAPTWTTAQRAAYGVSLAAADLPVPSPADEAMNRAASIAQHLAGIASYQRGAMA